MFHNWRDLTRQESQKIQNSDLECVFNTLFITSTWAWKVISGLIFSPAGSKKALRWLEYPSYICWVILCMPYDSEWYDSYDMSRIWKNYEYFIWISTVFVFRRSESNPEFGIFIYPFAVGQTYKNRWFESVLTRSLLRIFKLMIRVDRPEKA